jgi:AraC-like DNA-binding protein
MPPALPFADGSHRILDDTKMHQGSCTMLQMQPYHEGLFCWRTHRWLDERGRLQHNEQSSSLHGSLVPGYLYQLMEEMQRPQQYQQMVCDSLLQLLLGTLHRELQNLPVFETGELFPSSDSHKAQHTITQIEEYIQQNLSRDLTIEKMAQRAFMSRTAFTKKFRARTGKSLVRYVTDLRVEKARGLLRGTDLAVRHIAAAVGLAQNRLRVLFLQREGVPPSQYRDNHRKPPPK